MKSMYKKISELFGHLTGNESVSFRMFRIFFAFTAAGAVIFTILTAYVDTSRLKNDLMTKGRTLTDLLAVNTRIGVFAESREQLSEAISGVMDHKETLAVSVFSADGKELIRKVKPHFQASAAYARYKFSVPKLETAVVSLEDMIEFVEPVTLDISPRSEESIYFSSLRQAARER